MVEIYPISFSSGDSYAGDNGRTTEEIKYKKGKPKTIITREYYDNGFEKRMIKQKWNEDTQSWVVTRDVKGYPNGWIESFKRVSKKHPEKVAIFEYYDNANLKSITRTNKKGEVTTHKEYLWNGKRKKD